MWAVQLLVVQMMDQTCVQVRRENLTETDLRQERPAVSEPVKRQEQFSDSRCSGMIQHVCEVVAMAAHRLHRKCVQTGPVIVLTAEKQAC